MDIAGSGPNGGDMLSSLKIQISHIFHVLLNDKVKYPFKFKNFPLDTKSFLEGRCLSHFLKFCLVIIHVNFKCEGAPLSLDQVSSNSGTSHLSLWHLKGVQKQRK